MLLSCRIGWLRKLIAPQVALILALLCILPGCWVSSIHSLYEESKDQDVITDPNLAGTWTVTDDDQCTTTLTVTMQAAVYSLHTVESGEACSNRGEVSNYQARLVKLDAHRFLDVSPLDKDVCDMCIAKHDILLIKIDADSLAFTPIDSDWLKDALAAKTVTLSTLPDDSDTLTASSGDLKEFCRKFAEDKAVFKPDSTVGFRRAPGGTS